MSTQIANSVNTAERDSRFTANIDAVRSALHSISEWNDDNGRVSDDASYYSVLRAGMDVIDGNESFARLFKVV